MTIRRVANAGYFETVSFTADDASRNRAYALNEERRAALEQSSDMDGYLRGLAMTMTARNVGPADLARVTQLINKTNQFNLTTRRYTEAATEQIANEPMAIALSARLRDKFGDNGLISVVLARPDPALPGNELLIDTWLMSCRVLGRQVEEAMLGVIATEALRRGMRALVGEYRPSGRNGMVADHYTKLGFRPCLSLAGAQTDAKFWRYELGTTALPAHFIMIETQIEQVAIA
jgi:FkbH-like protein